MRGMPLALLREHGRRNAWKVIHITSQALGSRPVAIVWLRPPTPQEKADLKKLQEGIPLRLRKMTTIEQMYLECTASPSTSAKPDIDSSEL